MDIFISWSGNRSKVVAESLRDWLPKVIQRLKPWISASDIDKGTRGLMEISEKLGSMNFGIICLTPENLSEPWILFEAGALSKVLDKSLVCPILLDLDPSSVTGPLSQFQATKLSKEEILSLVKTLNKTLKDEKLLEKDLEEAFELWWPKLESEIYKIPSPDQKVEIKRSEKDIILEILRIVRGLERNLSKELAARKLVEKVFATLSPQEEKVLRMRFGIGETFDDTLEEMGQDFDITRDRIRQIEAKALRKLSKIEEDKST